MKHIAPVPEVGSNNDAGPSAWPFMLSGLAATALAWLWPAFVGESATILRIGLISAGLLAVGVGVSRRPTSVGMLVAAFVTGLLAYRAMDPAWDSLRLLVRVLASLSAAAAVLLLLPVVVRRVAVSVLILFHFGGIVTAVMTVPPTPWLANYVWAHFYRPYLEFMYLSNAYHFYSPEPGPACLLWAYVRYDDGTGDWLRMPRREDYPTALQYQRRLSLTESINQLTPPDAAHFAGLRYKRLLAGQLHGIPLHPDIAETLQYREPTPYSKNMLAAYARHIVHIASISWRPVACVKIYRAPHSILLADEFAHGRDPADRSLYYPYYQGEFDAEGRLQNPKDPFLYWLIPILHKDANHAGPSGEDSHKAADVLDFVDVHARLNASRDSDPRRASAARDNDSGPFRGEEE